MKAACIGRISFSLPPEELETAYAAEVSWQPATRINGDSRLVILGLQRLLRGKDTDTGERTALVLGAQYGAMESFEAFDHSLAAGPPQPRAFAHALPSTPVAAASIRFGFRGPTVTLSGGSDIGITALRQALLMLDRGRCDRCITGCWHMPSATTAAAGLPANAELLLLLLHRTEAEFPFFAARETESSSKRTNTGVSCVASLAAWLKI
jgi:hypothetical protein